MLIIENFIDGKFEPASAGKNLDVFEPAVGKVYAQIPDSGEADISWAVTSANRAFDAWKNQSADRRAFFLNRIADLLEENSDSLAEAESRDTGKPVSLCRQVDIPRAVSNFRFFAAAATQFSSESHAMADQSINFTLRQPLGVVACISPWNLPLYLLSWKVAPALACGNTVVAKPSEITPMTASLLAEITVKAGLPAGVLNMVHGTGLSAGAPLVAHADVKAVSFTGSTATGRAIAAATSMQFKKLSLEMGGKNPTLVFADCDLDKAVSAVLRSSFTNQGQICLCGSRILIEEPIYKVFKQSLLDRLSQFRCGDPALQETTQGAIVSEQHFGKITGYIDLARQEGGTILSGGPLKLDGRCANGWFIEPVLIEGLTNSCRTNQEEIFGPVATLQSFTSEAQALQLANDSRYGLACSIWSTDINRCHRLAANIECGIVWINCWMKRDLRTPFGGKKNSGLGHEGGEEVMRFFTEPKNICVSYGDQ